MKPIIALSTSYLQHDFPNDGYAMLQEAARLGFEYAELGHSTDLTSVEGIFKAVNDGVIKISSLHNFCPLPPFVTGALPNLFSPSTKAKRESEEWLRHTKNTINFAKSLNAKRIVAHMGAISFFFRSCDYKLRRCIDKIGYQGLKDCSKYTRILNSFKAKTIKRSLKQTPFILENLIHISKILEDNAILFGMENRDGFDELPFDLTFSNLLSEIQKHNDVIKNVGSWHDVGHSKIKELAGIQTQIELAEILAPTLVGWHLHDCTINGKDHQAIGSGDIDFKALSKFFVPERHIFTLELNRRVPRSDAADSLKRVQDLF